MNEERELERRLKKVTEAKKAAIADINFELATNLREEEKSLLKQLEEIKNLKKN